MKVKTPYQILFLVFVVLVIYYPGLFADFNSIDDLKMVNWIENEPFGSLWEVFRPGGRFYYRPLLLLTFVADHHLWGLQPGFMHLENMLIHAANTVLVFLLARRAFAAAGLDNQLLAWVAGLVFALHPIQTESVNWVSGRTDPLATFFVLAAMLVLVHALEKRLLIVGFAGALLFLAGVMSKEMSLFALPTALFLVWRWPLTSIDNETLRRTRLALSACFAGPFLLGAWVYLAVRLTSFAAGDPAINYVLSHFRYGPFDTVRVFFKVFGFYVKKLFLPLPLNFAIINANDHYVWLGLLFFALAIPLLIRRSLMSDFLVVSFFLTLPALIIALTDVAWTPLAERYLYLPSAFWSIAVVGGGYALLRRVPMPSLMTSGTALLLLAAGWMTFERNMVWQCNLVLFQDTVAKSPDYPPARNDLAIALMNAGRYEEAKEQYEIAQRLDPDRKVMNVHYNEAHVLLREEKYEEAAAVLDRLLNAEEKPSHKFLKDLARAYEGVLLSLPNGETRAEILGQVTAIYQQIYQQTRDPFVRYRQAQLTMFQGDDSTASAYFAEAYQRAPETAHYKQAALILAKKLGKE